MTAQSKLLHGVPCTGGGPLDGKRTPLRGPRIHVLDDGSTIGTAAFLPDDIQPRVVGAYVYDKRKKAYRYQEGRYGE